MPAARFLPAFLGLFLFMGASLALGQGMERAPLPLPDKIVLKESAELPPGLTERSFSAHIAAEDDEKLTVELSMFRGISQQFSLSKSDIETIERGPPDERPFAEIAPFLHLPNDSNPVSFYQNRILALFDPFVTNFPDSPRIDLVKEAITLHRNEITKINQGHAKINGRWFLLEELDKIDLDTLKQINLVQESGLTMTLPQFQSVSRTAAQLSASEFFPELGRLIQETSSRRLRRIANAEAFFAQSTARLTQSLNSQAMGLLSQIEAIVNQAPRDGTSLRPSTLSGYSYFETTGQWHKESDLNPSLFSEYFHRDGKPKRKLSAQEIERVRELIKELQSAQGSRPDSSAPKTGNTAVQSELAAIEPLSAFNFSTLQEAIDLIHLASEQVQLGLVTHQEQARELLLASVRLSPGSTALTRFIQKLPTQALIGLKAQLAQNQFLNGAAYVKAAAQLLETVSQGPASAGAETRITQNAVKDAQARLLADFETATLPFFQKKISELNLKGLPEELSLGHKIITSFPSAAKSSQSDTWSRSVYQELRSRAKPLLAEGKAAEAIDCLTTALAILEKANLTSSGDKVNLLRELASARSILRSRNRDTEFPAFREQLNAKISSGDHTAVIRFIDEKWKEVEREDPTNEERRIFSSLALDYAAETAKKINPSATFDLVAMAKEIDPTHPGIKKWFTGSIIGAFALLVVLAVPCLWVMSHISTHFDNLRFKFRVSALRRPKKTVLPKS